MNRRKRTGRVFIYISLVLGALLFIYPFFWMLMASLIPENQIGNFTLIPNSLSLNSYSQVVDKIPMGRSLLNSIFVSLSITAAVLVLGSMVDMR